ncbi:Pkinase-domain-containing protein [Cylindrobasidium torrendii FP15055 ss-10]|uniref:Pkinase-domain-containing protein n=1 Tax=Cylindrobasidium torrendii FP15055 ss-10 TaxID=1314674 RepID=A0A0D7AWF4_9AGAR|nr:Pkinase-domain-containing protein [Cylindrobasidium torrendii FP15055 ss-10]
MPLPKPPHNLPPKPSVPPKPVPAAVDPRQNPNAPHLKAKRILPLRRPREQERAAFGRIFQGCGDINDYDITKKLGEGTFGEVHKATHKPTGRMVALKRILMHNEKEGMPITALREIKILKALKHENVIEVLDMLVARSTSRDPLTITMVFPYMDHDLAGLLDNERVKLWPSQIKLYMKQLLEGTEYMHRNHILHRDMKAANLLISNTGNLRIADFGLARVFDQGVDWKGRERKYTNCVVTRWYRPPELLLGARLYGGEVDMWGVGCVFGEMFSRKPILPGTSDADQLDKIWELCGLPSQIDWPDWDKLPGHDLVPRGNANKKSRVKEKFASHCEPETLDLMEKMLKLDPAQRITALDALDHDYFWIDPMPADPKQLPKYEASHELDRRHHGPPPGLPPPQQHVPMQIPPRGRGGPPRGPGGWQPPPVSWHNGPPLQRGGGPRGPQPPRNGNRPPYGPGGGGYGPGPQHGHGNGHGHGRGHHPGNGRAPPDAPRGSIPLPAKPVGASLQPMGRQGVPPPTGPRLQY